VMKKSYKCDIVKHEKGEMTITNKKV